MANHGKFIDRLPVICAAGSPGKIDESVQSLSQQYMPEDHFEYLISVKHKQDNQKNSFACSKSSVPTDFEGAQACICPPAKSQFEEFYAKVYEAKYDSSKNRPLGKSRQCVSKPDNVNNENTTFGIRTETADGLYNLVLPNKIPFQVVYESEEAHDKYRLSHQHYFPAERINRKYTTPAFNEKHTFGKLSHQVPGGALVRRALEDIWSPEYVCISNVVQHDFFDRYKSKLGKPLQPNRITANFPANYTFGVSTPSDRYSGESLIYNRDPCERRTKIYDSLKYLNGIRNCLKKRISYGMEDMRLELEQMDTESTGELPLKNYICVMKDHRLAIKEDDLIVLLNHFNLLQDVTKINIKDFMKLLDCRHVLPDLGRLDDVFLPDASDLTTYRSFAHSISKDGAVCNVPAAGLPSKSIERELPKMHNGMIRADIDSLTEESDVRGLLSRSIPTVFGLSHRDYFMPRSKDEIKSIFSNVGFDLQDQDRFEEVWAEALKHWTCKNQMVSVEVFRHALKVRGGK